MASQPKKKKDVLDEDEGPSEKRLKIDDGENISRTGRQRKKSAKVLEMEAEADELEEVLKARVDPLSIHKHRLPIHKGPRIKKTPMKSELESFKEGKEDFAGIDHEHAPDTPQSSSSLVPETVSKSGRVRKKSAKLLEMVEVEELDRKIFRTSDIPKSMRNAVLPAQATPGKKTKPGVTSTGLPTSPVRSTGSSSTSPTGVSPTGSAIKLLLSSPTKKQPGPASPPPEPILSTLGASLSSPIKKDPPMALAAPTTLLTAIRPQAQPTAQTSPPPIPVAMAAAAAPVLQSPAEAKPKDFQVKFLADCPDVVLPPKPVKKKSKKQATPTPSAPAREKPVHVAGAVPQKTTLPKLKKLISPPTPVTTVKSPPSTTASVAARTAAMLAAAKKSPTGMAATMADQPLLAKMMGEVGQLPIGPPPPSSAEAKSMKKRAKKEAAAALKNQVELGKKKPKKEFTGARLPGLPKPIPSPAMNPPTLNLAPPTLIPFSAEDDDDDLDDEDDDKDHLTIDTSKGQPKKKKTQKKERPLKSKVGRPDDPPPPRLEMPVLVEEDIEHDESLVEDATSQDDEDDEDDEEDEDEDEEDEDVDVEVPAYANTQEMANRLQTSCEKKANKDKKKKRPKKEEKDPKKKKRGPTAYMLWCNAHRSKLVEENPGIDFATISKRLGEMWQAQPEKEKMSWKRKAKKLASKGSTVISTGKGVSQMVHGGSGATLLNKPAHSKVKASAQSAASMRAPASGPASAGTGSSGHQRVGHDQDQAMSPLKANGCSPLDVAAHLKLLGESLSIIGARLQEHHGQIAVQGTLPVLLDSLLCALGPLACLTGNVPQLDGAAVSTHAKTLDNIAYIMPGIG